MIPYAVHLAVSDCKDWSCALLGRANEGSVTSYCYADVRILRELEVLLQEFYLRIITFRYNVNFQYLIAQP
jgi:hypothetical protein